MVQGGGAHLLGFELLNVLPWSTNGREGRGRRGKVGEEREGRGRRGRVGGGEGR